LWFIHSSGKKKRDILETMRVIISSVYMGKWVAGNKIKKARPEGGMAKWKRKREENEEIM